MKNPVTTFNGGPLLRRAARFALLALVWGSGLLLLPPVPGRAQEAPTSVGDQSKADKKRIETEIVTLTPAGAAPAAIVRKAGPFFLYLATSGIYETVNVSLAPVAAPADPRKLQRLIDPDSLQKKKRSAGLVDLPPGEYHLQSAEGQVLCTITIQ